MKERKRKLEKILIGVIFFCILLVFGMIIYDKATVNNEYGINEKSINIPIFVYHNIVNDKSQIEYEYMQTTKDDFEKQIRGLKDFGYNFITYGELKQFKDNEIKLKKRSCILTFDDGLEGVYKNAYPVAKKLNIPFTIFIVVDNIGQDGCITWEQAREMQESGLVTIASHSMEHPNFSELTVEQAVQNVNDSYKIIEEKLGNQAIKVFTYPYGLYTEEEIVELEKQGYIQNLTDNKINKSKSLDLNRLHRCYPLSDSKYKILLKILYRSIRYSCISYPLSVEIYLDKW